MEPFRQDASGIHKQYLVYESREFFASSRCLKLANCLGFDLADALSRYLENMTNFFERVAIAITETVSEFNDFSLTIRKTFEGSMLHWDISGILKSRFRIYFLKNLRQANFKE